MSQSVYADGGGNALASLTSAGSLSIDAAASATGVQAHADARLGSGVTQTASAYSTNGTSAGAATAQVQLASTGVLELSAVATANANNDAAFSTGELSYAIEQDASAEAGTATASVDNAGSIQLAARATGISDGGDGNASADLYDGIYQYADAGSGDAQASFANSGTTSLTSAAVADGARAFAGATLDYGIEQSAYTSGGGNAGATLTSSGTLTMDASSSATATGYARAEATLYDGLYQDAYVQGEVGDATATFTNSGPLTMRATANATGSSASAFDYLEYGVSQYAYAANGAATAGLANASTGSLTFASNATATGSDESANATAYVSEGIYQYARAGSGDASVSLSNAGAISLTAAGTATGGTDANALASVSSGIWQGASANAELGDALVSLTNSGTISIGSTAKATSGDANRASATARIEPGIHQSASGSAASLVNSGTLNLTGSAIAAGGAAASADASVTGIVQSMDAEGATATFTNSGTMTVASTANATLAADSTGIANASASALGYLAFGNGFNAAVSNSGGLSVAATATAQGDAFAYATGMAVVAPFGSAALTGSVANSGTIAVLAKANGTVTSSASAYGVSLASAVNNAVVTNSGTLTVDAITANGGSATATGIGIYSTGSGSATDLATITNNGGSIRVRQSSDNGATWQHGTAITTRDAPNSSVINLLGNGSIYGNIDVAAGDLINVGPGSVAGSETLFDGLVNADQQLLGALTIGAGGTLHLVDTPLGNTAYDGPAKVYVDSFTVTPTGTLALDLPSSSTATTAQASYPQVVANTATLAGTLSVRPGSVNGLFANSYFFDNVIDANSLTGTFSSCAATGLNAALLTVQCQYDADSNVDLAISRTAFNAVAGLSANQTAVGSGLEAIYSMTATGAQQALFADLFNVGSAYYGRALDQLSGAPFASFMQSFHSLGERSNAIIGRATDCPQVPNGGSALSCRQAGLHLWGQADYGSRVQHGDAEAGDYDADQWTGVVGIDALVGPQALVGASIAKVSNRLDFHSGDARIKSDGVQAGLYAVYDPGPFFLKAIGSMAWLNADSSRTIDFRPLGGTVFGTEQASPDVRLTTLGLHAGARFGMGAGTLTPYANLDWTQVKLKRFTESGTTGAELSVSGKEHRRAVTGGVKFAGDIGGVTPELDLGVRHRFGDLRSGVDGAFAGDPTAFRIVSPTDKRNAALVGLSLGGSVAGLDVRVGYQGIFAGRETEHSGSFRIVLPLGGGGHR